MSQHMVRRLALCALAVATISGSAIVGLASPASADGSTIQGTCGQTFNPYTSGARAYWEVQCTSTQIRISGWVEDTAANGRCAKVKAIYPDGYTYYSAAACPKGDREYFSSPWRYFRSVNGYLYEYYV
jgi:hypothetical protein